MKSVIKLPKQDEYIIASTICAFRIAPPTSQHKGYRVFIDRVVGAEMATSFIKFNNKKSAQNFCANLKKLIDNANG